MSEPPIDLAISGQGVSLRIWVKPRSSRTRVVGIREGLVELAVAAPPVDGEANEEIVRFLSKLVGLPRSSVSVVGGKSSRTKTIRFQGTTREQVRRCLGV